MKGCVYVHGTFYKPEDASISVFDRGFLYGDSIYETLRVYETQPFALQEHLHRLRSSGELIAFNHPFEDIFLEDQVATAIVSSGLREAYLRIIITRGQGHLGLAPHLAIEPKLLIIVLPLPALGSDLYTLGKRARIVGIRRHHKDSLNPKAKTGNYMSSILALAEAKMHDVDEAIMLDDQGRVAEASSANVFSYADGCWRTPPLEVGILGGITRKTLLSLANDDSVAIREEILWPADLYQAEEIILCSSIREVVPVVELDGRPIADGQVGEHSKNLHRLYRNHTRSTLSP